MKTKRGKKENTTDSEEQHSKKLKLIERSSPSPPQLGLDKALVPLATYDDEEEEDDDRDGKNVEEIDHNNHEEEEEDDDEEDSNNEFGLVRRKRTIETVNRQLASRFQAVPLVASPTYPNAISWSNENLIAVASGHLVTILNPAMPSGPKGLITISTSKHFPIGVIERKDLLSGCMLPISLSRDIRPCVWSISWSPLGLAPNCGCLLAVCTTEGVVKVYCSPFREFSSEWIEVLDVTEMLHTYYEKIRYNESDFPFIEYNDDMPISKLLIRRKDKRQICPLISPQQYASRSAMLSSLVVSWSPMFDSNSSRRCSILAIGGKSGNISFWLVHEPECYSITQRSSPPGALLIGLIKAHDSWITAISWSKFDSDGSLLLSTGCSDGSVKIWRGYTDDLLKSTEDNHAAFSLLKDVTKIGSGPVSVLSLIVPETSTQKILLAIGKGSGSLHVWKYDTLIDKFDVIGPHYGHDQIITGLVWAYDGRCLYSCSQDNSLHSWIIKEDSLHEVSLPPNILGVKTFTDVPNVSDACFGIAISPANLVVAVVRSFDINLLNPMYQARSQKAAVEFFWIGGQKNLGTLKNQEFKNEKFPGFPNMDLVNWGQNILWSLSQHENLHKPLIIWDIISALSSFKNLQLNYVQQLLLKWLITNLGLVWGPPDIMSPRVTTLTSRQLHLLNVIIRHVLLKEENSDNNNGEDKEKNSKIWIKILEMSEKELCERIIGCSFSATLKGYNRNLPPVGLSQMRHWVDSNEGVVKDYVKLLASKVKKIDKSYLEEEECSYCSSPVPFEDTEVAFCKNENHKHKLARCAVSMTVCPLSPLWFCVSCKRWVTNFAPECLFTLTGHPSTVDFEKKSSSLQNGEILLKPLCPFCGVLLQRLQPEFLQSTTPV